MKAPLMIVTASLLLVGCESSPRSEGSPGMLNATCPFSGNPVGQGSATAQGHGETVGFCCAGCVSRWDGWSDGQKSDFVSAQD